MKLKFLMCLALALAANSFTSFSQSNFCGVAPANTDSGLANRPDVLTSCGRLSTIYSTFFKLKENYIPYAISNSPQTVTKKVKVRLRVGNPHTSTKQNFDASDMTALEQLVNNLNAMSLYQEAATKPQTSVCGSNCNISNLRLQFELQDVTFFDQTDVTSYAPDLRSQIIGGDSILNIFLIYKASGASGGWSGIANPNGESIQKFKFYADPTKQSIFLANAYLSIISTGPDHQDLWAWSRTLLHEFYHLYGLWHLWDGSETCIESDADYLKDIFNTGASKQCPQTGVWGQCWPSSPDYGTVTCDNNVMAITGYLYTSPMQMGIIHRESFLGRMTRYTYPTEVPTVHPWEITADQTWDFPIRLYQNVIVKAGKTLTVKCEVQMPPDGIIKVEKGGKLIVDGGLLTSYHKKTTWDGIEVYGDKTLSSTAANQGTVELKNGAIIQYARAAVCNYIKGTWNGGGIIKASNSHFYNCRRAVALNDYPLTYWVGIGLSNCSFDSVTFVVDDMNIFPTGVTPTHQFSSWNTGNGVAIRNCTFKNEIPESILSQNQRAQAIYTLATGILIRGTEFSGFKDGVYSAGYTGTPTRTVKLYNNNFSYLTNSITMAADAYADVRNNAIGLMYGGVMGRRSVGIYIDNTRGSFVGCGNNISGLTAAKIGWPNPGMPGIGCVANNTNFYITNVIDNNFNSLQRGMQTQLHNPSLNITCNIFNNNILALAVNPTSTASIYTLKNQGTACGPTGLRAGNKFLSNTSDIRSYLSAPWQYFAFWNASNTTEYPFNTSGSSLSVSACMFSSSTDPNSQCNKPANCIYSLGDVITPSEHSASLSTYLSLSSTGSKLSSEAQIAFGQVVRGFNDLNNVQGLRTFLETENDDNSRKLLIPLYIEQNMFTQATSAINALSVSQAERTIFQNYYNILIALKQQNRAIYNLTATERSTIQAIAVNSASELYPMAKALLEYVDGQTWVHATEELPLQPLSKSTNAIEQKTINSILLDASPNPASSTVTFAAFITDLDAQQFPQIIVRSINGDIKYRQNMIRGNNKWVVPINDMKLTSGIYIYSLIVNGKAVDTKRLSVVR